MKKIKPLIFVLFFSMLFSGCASSSKKNDSLNLFISGFDSVQKKTLFAHRGSWKDCPENTMEAFQAAYDKGLTGMELDVRFTKDEIPVVFHDKKLKRMSTDKSLLSSHTFEELREIIIGDKKLLKNKRVYFIPSFEEYCEWVSEKKEVETIIELKCDNEWIPGQEKILVEMIKEYGFLDRIIFASFDTVPLILIKKDYPDLKCSLITDDKKVDSLSIAKENGFDCVSLNRKLAKKKLVDECHKNNILVNAWTADTQKEIDALLKNGVDLITGNF